MSNPMVGSVYKAIIEEVIESSRTDFEEGGVDESVLEELRKVRLLSPFPYHFPSSAHFLHCVESSAFRIEVGVVCMD